MCTFGPNLCIMKLQLGFSPCPNDTFIFDAMIHHKIDTEGLEFEVSYEDVETLNNKVFNQIPDISKLSFHAFAYATEHYALLHAGSALGFGVGPLLISKNPFDPQEVKAKNPHSLKVGIPGKYTTANFLLGLFYPELNNKTEMTFSDIEDALISGEIDLGLIIHENRFTYQDKGLHKVQDLGEAWEQDTSTPIPLGGIVVRKNLDIEIQKKVNRVVRRSVEFAFEHPESGIDFIRQYAQTMSEEVMYKHINLYVNDYTVDLGTQGLNAVDLLFKRANALGIIPSIHYPLLVES